MPFGWEGVESGTMGLALSGGGFRATLFHCGTLWRLNECGLLKRLHRVSSVSGGAITAGKLAREWARLDFDARGVARGLIDGVVVPLREFCAKAIDVAAIVKGALTPGLSAGDFVRRAYDASLFDEATLQDLPDDVRFIFNSTNLATGVDFRFSKPYAGDYRIGLIERPTFRLSVAVAASSAFPPVLSPLTIDVDPALFHETTGADLYHEPRYRSRLRLTDGGAYDNLGLETLVKRIETVLVSDAGGPFTYVPDGAVDPLRQTMRVLDVTVNQARALRKRWLVEAFQSGRPGAYWGIATRIAGYGVADALPTDPTVPGRLSRVRTRLNAFTEAEQCSLINWGYALCDAAVRRYVGPALAPAPAWPYPTYRLDRPPSDEVAIDPDANLPIGGDAP
jgi:NTE family protein